MMYECFSADSPGKAREHGRAGHTNLGNILNDAGRVAEATACYRRALEVDPTYVWAYFDLANTLRDAGRMDEALEHYRQYLAVDSTHAYVAHLVRADPVRQGRGEEVRQKWKKELEADPPEHDAWFGYAELCLFLEQEEEYLRARKDLLRRFGARLVVGRRETQQPTAGPSPSTPPVDVWAIGDAVICPLNDVQCDVRRRPWHWLLGSRCA
jgi:tetratricopeptide (TPR) repeat protein